MGNDKQLLDFLSVGLAMLMLAWGYLGFITRPHPFGASGEILSTAQMVFGLILVWLRVR